ncbi:sensor histidine kinase [Paenibacillus qinlingensis]|uniref:histidine kinase n=1 Tax=Paenibacillus qinlingensis TaxID=1837343 RepID=A0ABU1P592_9BACL|nr:sensor histidine kinase [Paenibacillus qinlingensis]MDR6554227.1 signal transduction histidine kinase [Paenibacillus qinlingensis]
MFFQKRTGIYVFLACRWTLLLIGLLLYVRDHLVPQEFLLMAVLFQTLYSLVHTRQMPRSIGIGATVMDLCFTMYLLNHTGGPSSPFLVYSFTGLVTIKRHVTWRVFYSVILGYLVLIPLLFSSVSSTSMYVYLRKHLDYSVIALIFMLCVGTVHYGVKVVHKEYRKLARIYASSPYAASAKHQGVVPYLESVLKKVLDDRDVILCLTAVREPEKVRGWRQTYFLNYLKQNMPPSHKMYANVPSPTGEVLPFYIETLRDRLGNMYGWLLVNADKEELSFLHHMYIRFLLIRLEADYFVRGELVNAAEKAVAKERDTIAQNIHDGITQELFFISIQLFQLKQSLPAGVRDEILPHVVEIEKKVKESHREMRQFIIELKDEKRKINLHHAIEKLLHRVTEHTEVQPTFEKNGWIAHEQLEIEEAIYHLVEEATNNVIKHAQAKHIDVQIEVTSVQWAITIRDDGMGMNLSEENLQGRYGLGGMENRIKSLNGSLSFHSELGRGTTITAYIPRERRLAYV